MDWLPSLRNHQLQCMTIIPKTFEKPCMILGSVHILSWSMVLMAMIVSDRVGGSCLWNLHCTTSTHLLCLHLMNVAVDHTTWSAMCTTCPTWLVTQVWLQHRIVVCIHKCPLNHADFVHVLQSSNKYPKVTISKWLRSHNKYFLPVQPLQHSPFTYSTAVWKGFYQWSVHGIVWF